MFLGTISDHGALGSASRLPLIIVTLLARRPARKFVSANHPF
ncbi:unnamed protein product [Angiostrongylus costaricensis]|uniref:Transcriptional regulator n=1 Tax=Angiostrongylus costaricensis TaxID=334426 RepID=A0A0R3PPX8_ANGCS|nr:unnamed protein product [Angiostrongylus costaricensis]